MGKANRIKTQKAQDVLSTPMTKKKASKKAIPAWLGTTIVVVVLLAFVLTATFFALDKSGVFKRMRVVMATENFEINVPMMSYMVYTEYQNMVSLHDSYSEQLGSTIPIPGGTGGSPLDQSKALRDQTYATKDADGNVLETPKTWFDHFAELAAKDLKQMLAVCEAALADKVTLEQSDFDSIEATMQTTALYAQYYGYTTDGYLAAMYGDGVSEKDVRAMMEISTLSAKYNEIMSNRFNDRVGKDEVNAEYEANNLGDKENMYDIYVDYIGYTFEAIFKASTNSNTDTAKTENEKNAAEYEAKKAKYQALSLELETAAKQDPDHFVEKLRDVLIELFFEEEKEAALAKKTGENPTLTDDEIQTCRTTAEKNAAQAAADAIMNNANTSSISDKQLKDWLTSETDPIQSGAVLRDVSRYDAFGNEEKENATGTKKDKYANATSTYSVYLAKSGLHRDSGVVRDVGHILFKTDTYKDLTSSSKFSGVIKTLADRVLAKNPKLSAELMAKELLALMLEEGKLTTKTVDGKTYYVMEEEAFKAYGELYTEDSGVFYDDLQQTSGYVEAFKNWLLDEASVEGEVSYPNAVETEHGFHIMIYRGGEEPAWSYNIHQEIAENRYNTWLEDMTANVALVKDNSTNEKYLDMITG